MADFRYFSRLARSLQSLWHGRRINRRPVSGRLTMTFNFTSLQHIAVSAIGAIVTATLFISAAVGPAAQLV